MIEANSTSDASLVILNGRVWTGLPGAPDAEAVAIAGAHISAVGTTDEVRGLAGKGTPTIDAGGRRVLPGLTDSHTHLLMAGLHLSRVDLRSVSSREAFVQRVAEAAGQRAPGQWILGGQYAVEHWPEPRYPNKEWIDSVTPETPAFLTRADLHQALCNTRALQRAGIDRSGPADPPGGEIERDPKTGEPTGIVKESAMDLLWDLIPAPSDADNRTGLKAVCEAANRWGITSVHDMSLPADVEVFRAALADGELSLRVHSYVETTDFAGTWPMVTGFDADPDVLRIAGFKAFMDGSLGSQTAYMAEPFSNATPASKYPRGLRSKWAADWSRFVEQLTWAHQQGARLAVHAIGDQAVHDLLDVFEALDGTQQRRHRVEHAQHLLADDVARFRELGVIASMQPVHKLDDGPWAESAIGPERIQTMYAWGSLLRSGAAVCFGSDTPVATMNPFAGMAQAVTGRMPDGAVCAPAQNITLEQALRCYTVSPPYAMLREQDLGTIEPGKLADLAILERDILSLEVDEIHETYAHVTIVGGRVVWSGREM